MKMPIFSMTVFSIPVAQPRQRHRQVKKNDGQEFVMNYTDRTHPVQQFKADVKAAAQATGLPTILLDGPVALECWFVLPRPKSLMRKRDPDGLMWHTKKPDLDNLYKATKDALTGLLWRDDNQVVSYGPDHGKVYAEKDGRPRLVLALYDLSGLAPAAG